MSRQQIAYLVFDIETITDGRLLQRVRYPDEAGADPTAIVARHRAELLEAKGSDFIPATFQVPVSVAIAKVGPGHELIDLVTLDRDAFRPQVIARQFWQGWKAYGAPTFVTFNGRCFDLPVMELAAFRYGIALSEWFDESGPGYQHPRNRYNRSYHLDLQDVLTNFSAIRLNGGLDLLATLLGKPGKLDTKGYMVQDLWQAGERQRIDDYCMCDCLDTYFVFLRTRVLQGRLSLQRERELVLAARSLVADKVTTVPALGTYLDNFRLWEPVGDDDDPFVPTLAMDPTPA